MTKRELIKALEKYSDNDTVYFATPSNGGYRLNNIYKADKGGLGVYLKGE